MFEVTNQRSRLIKNFLIFSEAMENIHISPSEEFSECVDEDVLSLRNLPISGYEHEEISRRESTSSVQELFEFFRGFGSGLSRNKSVAFGDRFTDQTNGDEVNEYRKRDYLCLRSASFQKARDYQCDGDDREIESAIKDRSRSLRFSSSDLCQSKQCSRIQKVNITAITAMSAKSRRRMFMFGPVKFKPEMDVSAIRKRQSRRAPTQIPPMPEGSKTITAAGGRGRWKSGGSDGDGGLLKPLLCRSHLATALAKSFRCISTSTV